VVTTTARPIYAEGKSLFSIFIPSTSAQSPSPIIRGWYNRPESCRSTQSPTTRIKKKIKLACQEDVDDDDVSDLTFVASGESVTRVHGKWEVRWVRLFLQSTSFPVVGLMMIVMVVAVVGQISQ
jgi:hypothetical protein